jgi:hypothetical protein
VEWLQGWVDGVALALAGHVGNRINTMTVTSQRLVLLNLSVFRYLAFEDSLPSSAS